MTSESCWTCQGVEEAVHVLEYDFNREIFSIYEVQYLDHGYENLLVNAFWYALLSHKIGNDELALRIYKFPTPMFCHGTW